MKKIFEKLDQFWFATPNWQQMKLFRIVFGIYLFCLYAVKIPDLKFFYSNEGMMSSSIINEIVDLQQRISIFQHFSSFNVILAAEVTILVCAIMIVLGIFPRLGAIVAFILHVSFMRRNVSIVYGADLVSVFFLFYLAFADLRKTAPKKWDRQAILGSAILRLCQIQVCVIYFYSGLEKVKGPEWWNGRALWYVMSNAQLARVDFSWIAHFPILIYAGTLLTVLWETYFPVLVWVKKARYPMLVLGVFLHFGIAFGISLPFFGLLMIITYAVFLEPEHAAYLQQLIQKPLIWTKVRRKPAEESYV